MSNVLKELIALSQYFLFWLIVCFIDRLIFVIVFSEKIGVMSLSEIANIYRYGFELDLSVVSYISIIPFLFYSIRSFYSSLPLKRKILDIYTISLLFLYFITSFVSINIYREWGDKISKRAIDTFLASPSGAIASAESTPLFWPIIGVFVGILSGYFLYRFMFKYVFFYNIKNTWAKFVSFVLIAIALFTMIRGGYGKAPLNSSRAYYSENTFHNHSAVNTQWAFLRDYFSSNTLRENPYTFFETDTIMQAVLSPVFESDLEASVSILKVEKPNVVVIVLESFVGDLIESLGGEKGIAPNFEKLIAQGVLFDQIYAASDRSDKGMIGIYSGFPAQGPESIIKYIDKHEEMPAMGQELSSAGYTGSFYHGGQSEFYNFKSYMLTHGVSKIIDNNSFDITEDRSAWGVYDHIVLDKMLQDLDGEEQPFFANMFTINNHEPFDLPGDYEFGTKTLKDKFKSTAYYTDSVLYNFIEQAKTKDWYSNTLFVIIADHGHRLPSEKWELSHPKRFHIPLLFFGDVIKEDYIGTKVHHLGNQTDLVATLLNQLKLPTQRYTWSRDLLNPTTPQVAFYNSKDAFGIITPTQVVSYDNVGKLINYKRNKDYSESKTDSILSIAKAYYQKVYTEFLEY